MAETWYRLGGWNSLIEPVEIVKVTAKSLVYLHKHYDGRKVQNRTMSIENYFRTFDEAKAEGIERAKKSVQYAQSELDRCKEKLKNMNDFPKPPEAQ